MIRINQLKLSIDQSTEEHLLKKVQKTLRVRNDEIKSYRIVKKSIDARKKPELYNVYSIDVEVDNENLIMKKVNNNNIMLTKKKKYKISANGTDTIANRPVVIGAGPAGLFAAYLLAREGYEPLILERGKSVEQRTKDVEKFWETGVLDTTSNVQFGEGGAGTFSDGKLNTLVKDPIGRNQFVLETFVKYGAPQEIAYENKPHIGTDVLSDVIVNMRNAIISMGGSFLFESCVTDIEEKDGKISSVTVNGTDKIETEICILSPGHSARDTFAMLLQKHMDMEAKSFAVGFRVEHPQETVNRTQYGEKYFDKLPAAPYKVTANLPNGRGVYSFCMCPGGYVVNASSKEGHLAVNGMSYADRGSKNANSAIIVSVTPEDFDGTDPLSGVRFQEQLEKKAYELAGGNIPQQLFGDYCKNQPSDAYGRFTSETKGKSVLCNLRGLLSEALEESFIEGMHSFAKSIPDYDREDAILSGVESRTSSPVRIKRNEDFEANIAGIYPCGEGAGYAGGIMSAAMDGLKVAEAIIAKYAPKKRC